MTLLKHIPSHMTNMGTRIMVSYEGQPMTCYGCSSPGHQYSDCPLRKNHANKESNIQRRTWAAIVQGSTSAQDVGNPPHPVHVTQHDTDLPMADDMTPHHMWVKKNREAELEIWVPYQAMRQIHILRTMCVLNLTTMRR
jgi:hypothetical protein